MTTCEASYDGDGRLVYTSCETTDPANAGFTWYTHTARRTYEGPALVARSCTYQDPGGASSRSSWSFADTMVTEELRDRGYSEFRDNLDVRTYETDGLVLVEHPTDLDTCRGQDGLPSAPDALLLDVQGWVDPFDPDAPVTVESETSYTYDAPPRTGTRTRTGSDGSSRVFVYDVDGRLLEDRGDAVITYEYDGELLVAVRGGPMAAAYIHDRHGNVLRRIDPDDSVTTYDYSCW